MTQGLIFIIQAYETDIEVLNDNIIWSLNKSGIYDRHRGLTSQDQVIPHIGGLTIWDHVITHKGVNNKGIFIQQIVNISGNATDRQLTSQDLVIPHIGS